MVAARARLAATIALALMAGLLVFAAPGPAAADEGSPASVVDAVSFGGSGSEWTSSAGSDAAGNIYVVGRTQSADFPTKGGLGIPYGPNPGFAGFEQAFLTKLDPEGEIVYSTLLPAMHTAAVTGAVAPDGSVYVAYGRNDYPGDDSRDDINVLKVDPSGTRIVYSTAVPSVGVSSPSAIDVDDEGRAYVVGLVGAEGFPVTPDADLRKPNPIYPPNFISGIVRLAPGGAISYASYLDVYPNAIDVGADGSVYVAGGALGGAFGDAPGAPPFGGSGNWDGAVAQFSPSLAKLKYGAYVGGSGYDFVYAVAATPGGGVYFTGMTDTRELQQVEPLDPQVPDRADALYGELSPDGTEVRQLAKMGGEDGGTYAYKVEVAPDGAAIVVGMTTSDSFPSHGAQIGELPPTAALAFRVENRQLTHSTAYVNEYRSTAMGVVATEDGLVHVVGDATMPASEGQPFGVSDAFLSTLRLDPYVDDPYVEVPSRQRVAKDPLLKLRAGAREDVDLRASARLRVRVGGRDRSLVLRSAKRRAEGYEKASLALKPGSRGSARLLKKAVGNGRQVRAKVTVGFRDRGDAVARKHAWVTLVGRG